MTQLPSGPAKCAAAAAGSAAASLPVVAFADAVPAATPAHGETILSTITTNDGVEIFYKDWGSGQPIVFHHGWPLSADDWDAQMLYFVERGHRVIAHDRRGHGRSTQVGNGHDMDHYAADVAAVAAHLDLREAIHIGHSTGGGEATRYVARHGKGRVAKLVLIGAVPPIMVKTPANPGGLPLEVFDGFRQQVHTELAPYYSAIGRPSIDPVLIRMLILGYVFDRIMSWITSQPYPWCGPNEAVRDMPRIEGLAPVERYLKEIWQIPPER